MCKSQDNDKNSQNFKNFGKSFFLFFDFLYTYSDTLKITVF